MSFKGKHVLVSGGAGVIGTALVNALKNAGANLFVGDLKPKPKAWSSLENYREGDLITLDKKELLDFQPEIFFHLAATFERSEETYDFWEENYHHNIALSHHLMTVLKEMPSLKTIVFASSYLIYNPNLYLFPKAQSKAVPLKESDPIAPRNLCGMAKLLHEQELIFIKKFRPDLQVINARIFRSYGKNSRDIISRWIQALLKGEKLTVYRPEGRFDFVYAEDIAAGLMLLAETSFNGIVNLGSGRSRSIAEVIELLKTHFDHLSFDSKESDIPYEASEADMTLFHRLTNNQLPFQPLEQTLPEIIKTLKDK